MGPDRKKVGTDQVFLPCKPSVPCLHEMDPDSLFSGFGAKELNSEKGSDVVPDNSSSERKRSKYITGATPKSSKKTKLEKSIETVCLSLRESSEAEMKRQLQLLSFKVFKMFVARINLKTVCAN